MADEELIQALCLDSESEEIDMQERPRKRPRIEISNDRDDDALEGAWSAMAGVRFLASAARGNEITPFLALYRQMPPEVRRYLRDLHEHQAHVNALPPELFRLVFDFIDFKDVISNVVFVCRYWQEVVGLVYSSLTPAMYREIGAKFHVFRYFTRLKSLKPLYISYPPRMSVDALSSLTRLQALHLNFSLGDEAVEQVSHCTTLTSLIIALDHDARDGVVSLLTRCTSLTFLSLNCLSNPPENVGSWARSLSHLSNLAELGLRSAVLTDAPLAKIFAPLFSLKRLALRECYGYVDADVKKLNCLPLESLVLTGNALKLGSPVLRGFKSLTSLTVSSLTNKKLMGLMWNTNLRSLSIGPSPRVTAEGLQVLRYMPNLINLNLFGCTKITSLEYLKYTPKLRSLILEETKIQPSEYLEVFKVLPMLEEVVLPVKVLRRERELLRRTFPLIKF